MQGLAQITSPTLVLGSQGDQLLGGWLASFLLGWRRPYHRKVSLAPAARPWVNLSHLSTLGSSLQEERARLDVPQSLLEESRVLQAIEIATF